MNLAHPYDAQKYHTLDQVDHPIDSEFKSLLRQYYHEFKWSIIPIPFGSKAADVKWKSFQHHRPSMQNIENWFSGRQMNLAIVTGQVSGGVYIRDFDDAEVYSRWRDEHKSLAEACPTVGTQCGFHVYCRWGNPIATRTLIGGELRAEGAYTLLPPSTHPGGLEYFWFNRPKSFSDIPEVDPAIFGFEASQNKSQRKSKTQRLRVIHPQSDSDDCELTDFELEAIRMSLPDGVGQRNRKIFELARRLLAHPERSAERYKIVFDRWWDEAQHIVGTKDYAISLKEWTIAVEKATTPLHDPVSVCLLRAQETCPPVWTARMEPRCRVLAGLCRELQRECGDTPFYLSARKAGQLVGVSHVTASQWLNIFVIIKRLFLIEKGSQSTKMASTYRYVGDDL